MSYFYIKGDKYTKGSVRINKKTGITRILKNGKWRKITLQL